MAGAGIGLAVLLTAITADYIRIRLTNGSFRSLAAENQKQKEAIRDYETRIGSLEQKVNAFQEYAGKLNIFAGIKSPDPLQNPGVGGGPGPLAGDPQSPGVPAQTMPSRSVSDIGALTRQAEDIEKNLSTLLTHFDGKRELFATTPSIAPTVGWHSSGFGPRQDPFNPSVRAFHYGLDIATAYGSPVVAAADGAVLTVARDGYLGSHIIINHGNGYTTVYGHLSKVLVRSGQKIKRNDVIGQVGNTGRAIGTHVHYEIRLNGKAINPSYYILNEF